MELLGVNLWTTAPIHIGGVIRPLPEQCNTEMPLEHYPGSKTVDARVQLWKYMKRDHFYNLLESGGMFFCRIIDNAKGDHLEGAIPLRDQHLERQYHLELAKRMPGYTPENLAVNLSATGNPDAFGMRHSTIVTCFTMRDHEVSHMWSDYAGDAKNTYGVALRTTLGSLQKAFADQPLAIQASPMEYIDHDQDSIGSGNVVMPLLHKTIGRIDEHEFRLLHQYIGVDGESIDPEALWEPYGTARGLKIEVDLKALISEVWMSPHATEVNVQEVKDSLFSNGLDVPVRLSKMSLLHR